MNDIALLTSVIASCRAIDSAALSYYTSLNARSDGALKVLWHRMGEHKEAMIAYWDYTADIITKIELGRPIEHLDELAADMERTAARIREEAQSNGTIEEDFVAAARYELYVLKPGVATLVNFFYSAFRNISAEHDYLNHLVHFIDVWREHTSTPAMGLIGDIAGDLLRQSITVAVSQPYDPLTGLFNKKGFLQTIIPLTFLAQRNRFNVGIILVSLDNLAAASPKDDYRTISRMLLFVAKYLRTNVRRADLIARYDHDRFIIYISNMAQNSLFYTCERTKYGIEKDGKDICPISVSVGAAECFLAVNVYEETMALVNRAQECLEHARKKGGGIILNYKI
ncbi:MAG: diguanylate cyclase [Spirochaetota bacterium]